MAQTTADIVEDLWKVCDVGLDQGVTYQAYVTELTYLLFLKMAAETRAELGLPPGYRWSDLAAKEGILQLTFYRELLLRLGTETSGRAQAIYADASTTLREPKDL